MGNSDWLECRLADACSSIDYGYTASASATPVGPRFLRITDIVEGHIAWDTVPYVVADEKALEKYRLDDGDLVIARTGASTGASAYIQRPPKVVFASYLVRLKTKPEFDSRFIAYYLKSEEFWSYIRGVLGDKSAQPNASATTMTQAPLRAPRDKREQATIARVLGTLDDKIALNRRMNETLEAMAGAIFRSWFIDFEPVRRNVARRIGQNQPSSAASRHPLPMGESQGEGRMEEPPPSPIGRRAGDEGGIDRLDALFPDRFEDSELGEIPAGWEVGTVDEEFNLTMGQSPPGETYNETGDGLPFFQGRADFGFRFPKRRMYCSAPTRFAEKGDTLVSVRAPVGDINMATERCCVGRGVAAVRHKTGARSYTYYSMGSLEDAFACFEAEGTVFGSIGKKDFHGLVCVTPPADAVAAFERVVGALDDRLQTNEEQSRTLAAIRDALLPKLISGEVRVKHAERLLQVQP